MGVATVSGHDDAGEFYTHGCIRRPVEGGTYEILWECDHAHADDTEAFHCAEVNAPKDVYAELFERKS